MVVSIIVNSYNYRRFVGQAIESALRQTLPAMEVIVVDDGSSDDSVALVRREYPSVRVLAKKNGGQASALNAGYAASSGDWVLFLDADDWLEPEALAELSTVAGGRLAKIHFPLRTFSEKDQRPGEIFPPTPLTEGDAVEAIAQNRGYSWPPTSGNLFARWALERCLPIPEDEFRLCADLYLCMRAAAQGPIGAVHRPLGYYRLHGGNQFQGFRLDAGWLAAQAKNLVATDRLQKEMLAERGFAAANSLFDRRTHIELMALALRFGDPGRLPSILSLGELRRRWAHSPDITGLSLRRRGVARLVWLVLCHGPARLVLCVMRRRIAKAQNHRLLSSAQQPSAPDGFKDRDGAERRGGPAVAREG